MIKLFFCYFNILQKKILNFHSKCLSEWETKVEEAIQDGVQLSEKIKKIENAWEINDKTNGDFETLNYCFNKLMDEIYDYKAYDMYVKQNDV